MAAPLRWVRRRGYRKGSHLVWLGCRLVTLGLLSNDGANLRISSPGWLKSSIFKCKDCCRCYSNFYLMSFLECLMSFPVYKSCVIFHSCIDSLWHFYLSLYVFYLITFFSFLVVYISILWYDIYMLCWRYIFLLGKIYN